MDMEDPVLLELSRLSKQENINHKNIKNVEKLYLEEKIKLLRDNHKYILLSERYIALKSLSKKIINRYASLLDTSLELSELNQKICTLKSICKTNEDINIPKVDKIKEKNQDEEMQLIVPNTDEKDKKIKELEKTIMDLKQENILLQTASNKHSNKDTFKDNSPKKNESTFSFEISLPTIFEKIMLPPALTKEEDEEKKEDNVIKKYKEDIELNSELYDDKTYNDYDVEEKEFNDEDYDDDNTKIDESLEEDGRKRFCEHLMNLFEEMQYVTFETKENSEKKYLQILDVYNAYKKYLSFYISKERLNYIDKLIDEIDVNNLEEKNVLDFYYEISDLIFDPYLILD